MNRVNSFLDVVAFVYVLLFFPAPFFWLLIHPAIRFWRRLGKRAYWVALVVWIGTGVPLVVFREAIFAERIERNALTWILGLGLMGVAIWLDRRVLRRLGLLRLTGLPELLAEQGRGALVRDGIYAHLRHPRYLEYMITFVALALLTGAVGIFALAIATILMYLFVAPLEERELRDHYGSEYEAYAREVPRFIPRLRRNAKSAVSS